MENDGESKVRVTLGNEPISIFHSNLFNTSLSSPILKFNQNLKSPVTAAPFSGLYL